MSRIPAVLAVALSAIALPNCGSQCDRHPDEPPVVFSEGVADPSAHVYMSSPDAENPWNGPWLDFPPGRTYRFVHHLGGVPRDIQVWFAFNPQPLKASQGAGSSSGATWAAGNQGTLQEATADHVDIRNDTCSEVYVFVRIAEPVLQSTELDAGVVLDSGVAD